MSFSFRAAAAAAVKAAAAEMAATATAPSTFLKYVYLARNARVTPACRPHSHNSCTPKGRWFCCPEEVSICYSKRTYCTESTRAAAPLNRSSCCCSDTFTKSNRQDVTRREIWQHFPTACTTSNRHKTQRHNNAMVNKCVSDVCPLSAVAALENQQSALCLNVSKMGVRITVQTYQRCYHTHVRRSERFFADNKFTTGSNSCNIHSGNKITKFWLFFCSGSGASSGRFLCSRYYRGSITSSSKDNICRTFDRSNLPLLHCRHDGTSNRCSACDAWLSGDDCIKWRSNSLRHWSSRRLSFFSSCLSQRNCSSNKFPSCVTDGSANSNRAMRIINSEIRSRNNVARVINTTTTLLSHPATYNTNAEGTVVIFGRNWRRTSNHRAATARCREFYISSRYGGSVVVGGPSFMHNSKTNNGIGLRNSPVSLCACLPQSHAVNYSSLYTWYVDTICFPQHMLVFCLNLTEKAAAPGAEVAAATKPMAALAAEALTPVVAGETYSAYVLSAVDRQMTTSAATTICSSSDYLVSAPYGVTTVFKGLALAPATVALTRMFSTTSGASIATRHELATAVYAGGDRDISTAATSNEGTATATAAAARNAENTYVTSTDKRGEAAAALAAKEAGPGSDSKDPSAATFRSTAHKDMIINVTRMHLQNVLLRRFGVFKTQEARVIGKKDFAVGILRPWATYIVENNLRFDGEDLAAAPAAVALAAEVPPLAVLKQPEVQELLKRDLDIRWFVMQLLLHYLQKQEKQQVPTGEKQEAASILQKATTKQHKRSRMFPMLAKSIDIPGVDLSGEEIMKAAAESVAAGEKALQVPQPRFPSVLEMDHPQWPFEPKEIEKYRDLYGTLLKWVYKPRGTVRSVQLLREALRQEGRESGQNRSSSGGDSGTTVQGETAEDVTLRKGDSLAVSDTPQSPTSERSSAASGTDDHQEKTEKMGLLRIRTGCTDRYVYAPSELETGLYKEL